MACGERKRHEQHWKSLEHPGNSSKGAQGKSLGSACMMSTAPLAQEHGGKKAGRKKGMAQNMNLEERDSDLVATTRAGRVGDEGAIEALQRATVL